MKVLSQFPNIYRFITEVPRAKKVFYSKVFIVSFISGFLVMATFLKSYELVEAIRTTRILASERVSLEEQKYYWEQVVAKHSGYRDAYFKLAVLSYQLGDFGGTKEYLGKTFEIDPNFREGREFAKNIEVE